MATTPPPPGRLRTPPTPLHGPRYDDYEPYSPRRSARVSAQRKQPRLSPEPGPSRGQFTSRLHMHPTATPAARKTTSLMRQISSQTLSPPSSPDDRRQHLTPRSKDSRHVKPAGNTPDQARTTFGIVHEIGEDRYSTSAMLPTPNKTPRKRVSTATNSTARILNFKSGDLENAMPSPRKRKQPLTLDSFDEEQAKSGRKIDIFTDSQDRVPSVEVSDANPFMGDKRTATRGKKASKHHQPEDKEAEQMLEAVRNDEGVLYVFRGKKIFRRFESPNAESDNDNDPIELISQEASLRRQAGVAAQRPFTRSSLKPRLLFPRGDQTKGRHERGLGDNADNYSHEDEDQTEVDEEEALTDIEGEDMSAKDRDQQTFVDPKLQSPAHHQPELVHSTPDSTQRKSSRLTTLHPPTASVDLTSPSVPSPRPQSKSKKTSPFDSWQRTKPSATRVAGGSKKRAASPEPDSSGGKRTRSAAH